jgi:hypothetical protein
MEFVCIPVNLNNQHWIAVLIDKSKGLVLLFDPYGERHDWVLQAMLCWLREECSTRNVCLDIEWRTVTVPVPQHSFLHQTDSSSCGLLMLAFFAQRSVVHSCRICLRFLFGPRPRPYTHVTRRLAPKLARSAVFDISMHSAVLSGLPRKIGREIQRCVIGYRHATD